MGHYITGTALSQAEANFGQDFNADGITGAPLRSSETAGSISLLKSTDNEGFAQDSDGNQYRIKNSAGNQVSDSDGWTLLGAETVNGSNQVIWGHANGSFYQWSLDSNWKCNSDGHYITGTALSQAEANFGQDFNADGITGAPLRSSETAGSISLLKSTDNEGFAQDSDGNQYRIKNSAGNQVSDSDG